VGFVRGLSEGTPDSVSHAPIFYPRQQKLYKSAEESVVFPKAEPKWNNLRGPRFEDLRRAGLDL